MRTRINQLGGLGAALVLLAASTASSQAGRESIPTDVDDQWIPSFSFSGGALFQTMESGVQSYCEKGRPEEAVGIPGVAVSVDRLACRDPDGRLVPPSVDPALRPPGDPNVVQVGGMPALRDKLCPNDPSLNGERGCLRPNAFDDQLTVSPFVSYSLELMTPRLGLIPGRPRGFVGGELLTIFGQERSIAKEGNPSELDWPDQTKNNASVTGGSTLFGTGSTVDSEVQLLGYSARGGFAFPITFRERRLWLKPSFGWLQYEVDFQAQILAGIKDDPVDDPNAVRFGPGIREVGFSSQGSETFNSIGPGFELEMEAGRFGPLGISIFINAAAYFVLGERTFSSSATVFCPDANVPGTGACPSSLMEDADLLDPNNPLTPVPEAFIGADTFTGEFEFAVDQVAYRGGLGIRFNWLGR